MSPDPYEVLGVKPNADIDTIKAAYRQLVRANHPDIAADKAEANARMVVILEAWRTVADPDRRARLDSNRNQASNAAKSQVQHNATARPPAGGTRQGAGGARSGSSSSRSTGSSSSSSSSRSSRDRQSNTPRSTNSKSRLLGQVNEAAQLYFREGRADDAISLCQRVLKTDSRNLEATILLGDIYSSQGSLDRALILFERALLLQPNNVLVRRKRDSLRPPAPRMDPSRWPAPQPVPQAVPQAVPEPAPAEAPAARGGLFGRLKAKLGQK